MKNAPSKKVLFRIGPNRRKVRLAQLCLAAIASCVTQVHGAGSTVVFNAPTSIDLLGGGVGDRIAIGDFNRDGDLDLVTTPDLSSPESYPNVDGVTLLYGDGQGGFPQNGNFLAGEYLTGIATADFNNDGILDLVTTEGFDGAGYNALVGICSTSSPRVPVFLGAANGTFSLQLPCLSAGRRPGAVATGDFDEDGIADLVVTISSADINTVDRNAQFLSSNGNGTFTTGWGFLTEKSNHVATADFNRDGHLDLVMPTTIYLGTGRGTFTAAPMTGGGEAVGDINGDGIPDLASLGTNNINAPADDLVRVRIGQPDGSYTTFGAPLPTGADPTVESHPIAVAIADVNGDGYGDVVVANGETDDVAIYLRDPAGTFHTRQSFSTRATSARGTLNTMPKGLAVADLNKDGYPDIVVSNYNPSADGTPDDGTVTVLIQDAVARPAAADDTAVTSENTAVLIDAFANDFDRSGMLAPASLAVVRGPVHGSAVNAGSGKFTYTPTTGFAGVDNFTYTISNTAGVVSNIATATILVKRDNKLPVAFDDTATTPSNAAVTIDILTNDYDPDGSLVPGTVLLLSLPASGSANVDPFTGAIDYQPGAAGTYNFTYTVQDSGGATTNVATVSVTVVFVNTAPVAANDSASTTLNTPVTISVLQNDADPNGDTLVRNKVAIARPPAHGGVTVNTTTGSITYTPALNYNGGDSFDYTVKDSRGATSNAATVTVNVTAANKAPVASNGTLAASEDTVASGSLVATDPEGGPLTFSIVSNGGKGVATITNTATGAYTYTPQPNANGSDSFTFRASNGSLNSNPATVTVSIASVNDAPQPTASAIATNEDTVGTSQVAPNDPDAGDSLGYNIATAPLHGTASVSASGLVSYTPAANYNGPDSLVVRVTDQDGAFGQVTIPVAVATLNDAPQAANDSAATPQGTAVTVNVLANDSDVDGTLNPAGVTLVARSASGSVTVNPSTGAITYTPVATFSGSATFTYTVKDNTGATSNAATVTVNVTAGNQAPVASNGTLSASEDTVASGTLVATDPEGGPLTFSIVSNGGKGVATITNAATGAYTYTPQPNANGSDSFTFRASDGSLNSNPATVTVSIAALNDAPKALNDSAATPQGTAVTVNVLANDSDVDGTVNPASVTLGSLPASGSVKVNPSTGVITYTPEAAFSGSATFTYTVKDNTGATSNAAIVTVNVTAGNKAPVVRNGTLSVTEDIAASGTLIATDPEGGPLTFSIVSNGGAGVATITNAATGAYTYTPQPNANGGDSFTFRASDGSLNSNVATVRVIIRAVNDAPQPTASAIATDEDTVGTSQVVPNDLDSVNSSGITTTSRYEKNRGNKQKYRISSAPLHGKAKVSENGFVIYIPSANYSGPDSLVVRVTDKGGAFGEVTIPVMVAAVNDAPQAANDSASAKKGTAVTMNVLANDSDVDGTLDPASVTLVTLPASGSVTVNPSTGAITYTPEAAFSGSATFTYTVKDNTGATSNAATVRIKYSGKGGGDNGHGKPYRPFWQHH